MIHYQRQESDQAIACFQPRVEYLREIGHADAEERAAFVEQVIAESKKQKVESVKPRWKFWRNSEERVNGKWEIDMRHQA